MEPRESCETSFRSISLLKLAEKKSSLSHQNGLMVKIQETVETVTSQFLAKVGSVGPVTLKNKIGSAWEHDQN